MSMSELGVVIAVSAVVAAVAAKVLLWKDGVAVESYVCHRNRLTGPGQSANGEGVRRNHELSDED